MPKKKNNIIDFPSSPTKLERQIEAICLSSLVGDEGKSIILF